MYTVLTCCNAIGDFYRCSLIYKGLHLYSTWCVRGPEKARYNCSPSGWMEAPQFLNWFRNCFIPETLKLDGTKLSVLDGHNSHVSLELIDAAAEENIEIVCLPANTWHLVQPLDVGVYKAVKASWRGILRNYYNETVYKNFDKLVFPTLMKKISESACLSRANAIGGFEGSGIYPLCKEKMTRKIEIAKIVEEGENSSPPSTSSPAESVETVRKNRVPSASSNSSISTSTKQPSEDLKQGIERTIMTILQYKHKKETTPSKRSRVSRKFAESLRDAEIIERMCDIQNKKQLKLNKSSEKKTTEGKTKIKRKIDISSSSESDVSVHVENNDEEDDFCDLTIENEINVNELDNNNHLPDLTQDRELNCPKGITDVSHNNDSQEIPDSNKNNDNKQEQQPVVVGK
ncbi:hypothetical protein NQ314_001839 [Rhamnusium bicolor]|uniref:DDE-1 domain-containing protein n=1 Tax=Rhamnusium bicolor TaxID=1586634 RepID=A0AAV8ZT52_9CUCU|nr:hypothetical protein NQ314_001839 [Rhamnusium bicolor]